MVCFFFLLLAVNAADSKPVVVRGEETRHGILARTAPLPAI